MMYYSVCLVHRILNQKYPLSPTFEQTWMLIVADSEEDAKQKTSVAGMEKEETFYNQKGDEIHWYFEGYQYLQQLEITQNGAEIFSQLKEPEKEDLFLRAVQPLDNQNTPYYSLISAN